MKVLIIIILVISGYSISAQKDNSNIIKPRFGIELTTMKGNMLKGLLLQVNDTSLIIYPGKRKDWNKGEAFYPVVFGSSNVMEIKLKKQNGIVKGMLLGGSVGLSAILTTILLNNATAKSGSVNNVVIVVPAGIIGGAYMGSKSRKNFYINGNEKAFSEFQKQIK